MPQSLPSRHPSDLLANMEDEKPQGKDTRVRCTAFLQSKGVAILLDESLGALQIQFEDRQSVEELYEVLHRVLNTWDLGAPQWVWQLDSFLSPLNRQIARNNRKESKSDGQA